MKKAFAAFAAILPLTILLCACGETAFSLHANWYKDGGKISATKSEQLEYEVTFKPADETASLPVRYGTGTYTAELTVEDLTPAGGAGMGYHLRTELSMPVTYTAGESSVSETDRVVSDVWFMDLDHNLQPVKSVKKVRSTSPINTETCEVYEYTYTVEYIDTLSKATISYEQTKPEAKSAEKTISVKSKDIFFDNEQLLFVLRGIDMASSVALKTINPLTMKETDLQAATPVSLSYENSFTVNGESVNTEEEKTVKAYGVTLSYGGNNSGMPQKLVYAANTTQDKGENSYRNVLLEMNVSILGGLGTLDHQLKNATFND